MALFQASGEQLAEYKQKLVEEVTPHIGGEELVAVGMFRRGGFGASYAASKMGGGLVYAGVNLARKKRAGGLPDKLMLAVTPSTLYAFTWKYKGRNYRVKEEVARWDRANLECSRGQGGNMTTLTIASPTEGEKATVCGAGVQDDPWSQEVIGVLTNGAAA
jgi:hypothetical protein